MTTELVNGTAEKVCGREAFAKGLILKPWVVRELANFVVVLAWRNAVLAWKATGVSSLKGTKIIAEGDWHAFCDRNPTIRSPYNSRP